MSLILYVQPRPQRLQLILNGRKHVMSWMRATVAQCKKAHARDAYDT
jgi:hypothetical protein